MTDRDPKFAVGSRPVNRRTAARAAISAGAGKVAVVATQRVRSAQARNRLGSALQDQLLAPSAGSRQPPAPATIAGAVVAACGATGLFFAWLHGSLAAGIVGGAVVAGGLLLTRIRGRTAAGVPDAPPVPLFDPAAVRAFDRAVEHLATELADEVVQPLTEIKQVVVRMARHPDAGTVDEHFQMEDRLYANECLRRYLPDSLEAYLAVPRERRTVALAGGETAQGLLLAQLALLKKELEQREAKLARRSAEALLKQQRFLQSKAGR